MQSETKKPEHEQESEIEILYRKNFLSPVTHHEQRKAREISKEDAEKQTELYEEIGMNLETPEKVEIEKNYLEREWVELQEMKRPADIEEDQKVLQKLWKIFNDYDLNPLSAQNEPGNEEDQPTIQEHNVDHTSMSVGDIVKLDGTMYIACSVGWAEVEVIE